MKAIVTVVGKDTVGIIAKVCTYLAENQINILDISQTIMQELFTMVMLVDMTDAENILWYYLRNRQLNNLKFRRQEAIENYIVDFVCYEKKIILELDGGQHLEEQQIKHDQKRDKNLSNAGFKIIRIYNTDVFKNIEGVIEYILNNFS